MTPPRGLLLAGTDTGVGKTTLAQGLLRLARRHDLRLVPYKPVETGCNPHPEDARKLTDAAALPDLQPDDICPYQFLEPVAPSLAATFAGTPISPDLLQKRASSLLARGDALLVECAGGLLTPYGQGLTSSSLSTLFDVDILLVSANRLGAINHTALALDAIQGRRLPFAGLVLVDVTTSRTPDRPQNSAQITALTGVSPLGTLRHCPSAHPDDLADAVAADLDLRGILRGLLAGPSPII